jgi:hypothetical protein
LCTFVGYRSFSLVLRFSLVPLSPAASKVGLERRHRIGSFRAGEFCNLLPNASRACVHGLFFLYRPISASPLLFC